VNLSKHATSIFKHCQAVGMTGRRTARRGGGRTHPTLAGASVALPSGEGFS